MTAHITKVSTIIFIITSISAVFTFSYPSKAAKFGSIDALLALLNNSESENPTPSPTSTPETTITITPNPTATIANPTPSPVQVTIIPSPSVAVTISTMPTVVPSPEITSVPSITPSITSLPAIPGSITTITPTPIPPKPIVVEELKPEVLGESTTVIRKTDNLSQAVSKMTQNVPNIKQNIMESIAGIDSTENLLQRSSFAFAGFNSSSPFNYSLFKLDHDITTMLYTISIISLITGFTLLSGVCGRLYNQKKL